MKNKKQLIAALTMTLLIVQPVQAAPKPVCVNGRMTIVQSAGGRAYMLAHGATEPLYGRCRGWTR